MIVVCVPMFSLLLIIVGIASLLADALLLPLPVLQSNLAKKYSVCLSLIGSKVRWPV
jgi:hypothetical protein